MYLFCTSTIYLFDIQQTIISASENENQESEDEENDEDEYDDEVDEVLIEYNYDTKSIERIKMLSRAEFDLEIEV